VYAHRGGSLLRPENTIAAFDHGLALGADGLEFDVHFSRDGVVVVHHDSTLERTTNGRGPIAALTAGELSRLDAGAHFPGFAAAVGGVPRLRDVLQRYTNAAIIIELKLNEPELAHRTIDDVRAADAVDRVALGSYGSRVLRAARAYEPCINTGASAEETRLFLYRSWCHWPVRHPRYREFQVPEMAGSTRVVSPRFVRYAHEAGCPVKVWTVDEESDMRRLLSWGVDAIISDRPDIAVHVVREVAGH
ncbi:MAG TPA: glycerophosphodiester phosphodiesterase, partial [Vicinamibacterales bacterium]